jgi:homoserine dehydrogenase
MRNIRLAIVGFGVVGQGLAELLHTKKEFLRQQFDLSVSLVGVANARSGFIYKEDGLDIPLLLEITATRQPLTQHPNIQHWEYALEGLQATQADILAEATGTNLRDAEPGLSHIRAALTKSMHVITANKGPVALDAIELLALAHQQRVQLRMESTVMAGTPVLSTISQGLAGSRVRTVRGILNGTTNYILTAMAQGRAYEEVLKEAQAQGYAEADPTADVEGYDAVAKVLILAALAFGHSLKPDQVTRQGITAITKEQMQRAVHNNARIKLIASLHVASELGDTPLEARVEPIELPLIDPLARVDGVMNAITLQTDTLSSITIIGPGAGRLETGLGLLSDLIAIAKIYPSSLES